MSRLSLKTLKLKKLPHGHFAFKVLLKRNVRRVYHCSSNAGTIQQLRDLLRASAVGQYRFNHQFNWNRKRVYTEMYLTNPMDLALIKLVHADKLHKIYKIKIETPDNELV